MIPGFPLRHNIGRFYTHYDKLLTDIYPQPSDVGHTAWSIQAISSMMPNDVISVLDIGCGDGFCEPIFSGMGKSWTGLSANLDECNKDTVRWSDMAAIASGDDAFDMVFARHVLEHSPFPLIALMEWRRVSKRYALIILPAPDYWRVGGRNHYFVLYPDQWKVLFERAEWKVAREETFMTFDPIFLEYYMVDKKPENRVWKGEHKAVEYRYLLEKIKEDEK